MCVPWELNPQPFALLTQCSTTETQEHKQSKQSKQRDMKQRKKWRMEVRTKKKGRRKDKQTSKRKKSRHKQTIKVRFMWTTRRFTICQTLARTKQSKQVWKQARRLRNTRLQSVRRSSSSSSSSSPQWQPICLAVGSVGRQRSLAWEHRTTCLGCTMLKMPFLSGSHTNTLETSSSHGTNKTNCDLHFSRCSSTPPQTLNPCPNTYSGKLSVMFARGALRKWIRRWGRLNHDVQDEARIYDR